MNFELGIALDPGPGLTGASMAELSEQAEWGGLDLVVVLTPTSAGDGQLDPWTTAAWITGSTSRIQIGVADPSVSAIDHPDDPEATYPAVAAKARDSLDALAGTRLIEPDAGWVMAPADAGAEELAELGATGRPVVVPVRTAADVERVVALASDRERAPGARSTAARSRRRHGIDYDGVPKSLVANAVEPGDPGYRAVRSTYLRAGSPGLVLRPRTPAQVADALAFARRHTGLPLGVRSGGHGISGRSTNDGGLVIDVGAMNRIEMGEPASKLIRVGPGATWKQVAAALDSHGWAIGSGDYGGVGVGGLATAGGIGFLSRLHGLTIDQLRAVELVLADGRQLRASERDNPDLFWAVRGAGANFGVATAFEFEAQEVGEVGWAQLVLVSSDLENALHQFGEISSAAPRDTTIFMVTSRPRQGQAVLQLYGVVASPEPDVIVDRLMPLTSIGSLAQQQVVATRYRDVMGMAADVGPEGHSGYGEPVSRSAFLPELTPAFAHDAAELLRSGLVHFFAIRTMGGAIADQPAGATAFSHRSSAFQVTAMGADREALDRAWDGLAEHFDGLYLSFDTDLRTERIDDAFPEPVLTRLRQLKQRYDPDNLFRDNFNIDPRTPAIAPVG